MSDGCPSLSFKFFWFKYVKYKIYFEFLFLCHGYFTIWVSIKRFARVKGSRSLDHLFHIQSNGRPWTLFVADAPMKKTKAKYLASIPPRANWNMGLKITHGWEGYHLNRSSNQISFVFAAPLTLHTRATFNGKPSNGKPWSRPDVFWYFPAKFPPGF